MKLDRLVSGAVFAAGLAATVAFAGGCSNSVCVPHTPTASEVEAAAAATGNATDTTNLMFAQIPGPAPKVGKAHLAVDAEQDAQDATSQSDEQAPKMEARRSDGSRRGGGFGSSK
jgi:hypothetical protein